MNLNLLTPPSIAQPPFLEGIVLGQEEARPPLSILFVEDNDDLRFVLKCTLEALSYRVVACADAESASVAFRLQPRFDVLLTDFEMPGRSGMELARELTELLPLLPVVLYTGSELSTELLQEIRGRHWEYLSKPCNVSGLESTLTRVLTTRLPKAA